MKHKILVGLLIVVFVFSSLSVALASATVCPRCHGTGKITVSVPSSTDQGSATSGSNIEKRGTFVGDHSSLYSPIKTSVKGVFYNQGDNATGTVTATIETSGGTFTNATSEVSFPANEEVSVIVPITIIGVNFSPDWRYKIEVSDVGNVGSTDSSGLVSEQITCPDCGGTGVLSASLVDIANPEGLGGIVVGVAVVGAVVVGAVFVMKKRRVTEASLRRLSSFEFQDWVSKKLGNSTSQRDSYLGVDGFTAEGYPFQVRQEDDVGKRAIDSFAMAVGRAKARSGTIVAFSFGRDALEGVTKARLNYRVEIKTVTVRDLMASQKRPV